MQGLVLTLLGKLYRIDRVLSRRLRETKRHSKALRLLLTRGLQVEGAG
jgi:hypothetical protein